MSEGFGRHGGNQDEDWRIELARIAFRIRENTQGFWVIWKVCIHTEECVRSEVVPCHPDSKKDKHARDTNPTASIRAQLLSHGNPGYAFEIRYAQGGGRHTTLQYTWCYIDGLQRCVLAGKTKQRNYLEMIKRNELDKQYIRDPYDDGGHLLEGEYGFDRRKTVDNE